MGQAANRKGRAAMTRKTYCGNLLWQSGLILLALRINIVKILEYEQSYAARGGLWYTIWQREENNYAKRASGQV
jgi:hypothetical protein